MHVVCCWVFVLCFGFGLFGLHFVDFLLCLAVADLCVFDWVSWLCFFVCLDCHCAVSVVILCLDY